LPAEDGRRLADTSLVGKPLRRRGSVLLLRPEVRGDVQ
jgi:hypothetical protein